MSWDAIDVVLTMVIKIDRNNISTNLSILLRYGFYVVILSEILCNGNCYYNSKTSQLKNTYTHGSSALLFNSKVLARSYVTPSTIDKH